MIHKSDGVFTKTKMEYSLKHIQGSNLEQRFKFSKIQQKVKKLNMEVRRVYEKSMHSESHYE